MTITTLIFDIDGVLIDFVDMHCRTFIEAFNQGVGKEILTQTIHDEYLDNFTTRNKLQICRKLFPGEDWNDEEIYKLKQETTMKFIRETSVSDRIFQVLNKFKQDGYAMGCYTNTNRTVMEIVLTKLGLWKLFESKVSNQDVINPKPHPEGYIKVMKDLNANPKQTLIFEDSLVGQKAAHDSGAITIPVKNSLDITKEFVQHAIDHKCHPDFTRADSYVEHVQQLLNS